MCTGICMTSNMLLWDYWCGVILVPSWKKQFSTTLLCVVCYNKVQPLLTSYTKGWDHMFTIVNEMSGVISQQLHHPRVFKYFVDQLIPPGVITPRHSIITHLLLIVSHLL